MGVDDGEVVLDLVSAAREDNRDEDLPTVVKRSGGVEVSPGLGDEALEERDEVLVLGHLRGGADDAERVDEVFAPVADHGELVGDDQRIGDEGDLREIPALEPSVVEGGVRVEGVGEDVAEGVEGIGPVGE